MSIQQGVNQLLGFSMIAGRLSPKVELRAQQRAKEAELNREATTLQKSAGTLKKAMESHNKERGELVDKFTKTHQALQDTNLTPEQKATLEETAKNQAGDIEALEEKHAAISEMYEELGQKGLDLAQRQHDLNPNAENTQNLINWKSGMADRTEVANKALDTMRKAYPQQGRIDKSLKERNKAMSEYAMQSLEENGVTALEQRQKFADFKKMLAGETTKEEYMSKYGGGK